MRVLKIGTSRQRLTCLGGIRGDLDAAGDVEQRGWMNSGGCGGGGGVSRVCVCVFVAWSAERGLSE